MKLLSTIFVSASLAFAQGAGAPPSDDNTIKVDVDLVNVVCSVHNKSGGLVGGLEKQSFKVFEDGKEQPIKFFARETNLPLTIGLLVDTSGSQERLIETERRAADQFFQKVLGKKDEAFLLQFGSESELLQDSTNSPKLLRDGLKQLRLSTSVGGLDSGPVPTAHRAGTVLYDAIYLAATEKLRTEVGRKAIVVITDGVDEGSRLTRDKAIEAAQKADTIIYSIYYSDRGGFSMGMGGPYGGGMPMGGNGESELNRMSSETGGRVFKVSGRTTLDDIFQQIQDEMRSQYSIAYSPSNPKKDGTYRKLEIRLDSKDNKVQARKGYYAIENGDDN